MAANNAPKMVHVSRIAILPQYNFSRGEKLVDWFKSPADENSVITMLVGVGWKMKDGLAIVTPIGPADVKQAMAIREKMFVDFTTDTTDYERDIPAGLVPGYDQKRKVRYSAADFAVVAKQIFCDKKGNIIQPDLDLVCAFRRLIKWLEANVIRHRLGLSLLTDIPVEEKVYESKLARVEDCLEENERKLEGTLPTTRNQKAIAVYDHIFCLGGKQIDARRTMKDGMGQWCWELSRANDKYPTLAIIDTIRKDGFKELSRIRADALRKLIDAGVSDEDMSAFFAHPGEGSAFKIMKKGDIQGLAEQCPNPFIRAAAKAIYRNDPTFIAPLLDAAPVNGVPFKDGLRIAMIQTMTDYFVAAGREAEAIDWLKRASS